jgi:hypothetical protein
MTYTVKYHAGTYSGTRTVTAEDEDEAIAKVRGWVRREMSLPMYSDSYRIISSQETDDDE